MSQARQVVVGIPPGPALAGDSVIEVEEVQAVRDQAGGVKPYLTDVFVNGQPVTEPVRLDISAGDPPQLTVGDRSVPAPWTLRMYVLGDGGSHVLASRFGSEVAR